jgi:hypothetical protein
MLLQSVLIPRTSLYVTFLVKICMSLHLLALYANNVLQQIKYLSAGYRNTEMGRSQHTEVPFIHYLFIYLLTYFFFPEGGVGLVRKRGCLLTLANYAFSRRYEFGERRRNDILTGENRKTRRKTCPSATFSTTNPTWIDPGANPGLRGERPATNDLRHGTALITYLLVGDW